MRGQELAIMRDARTGDTIVQFRAPRSEAHAVQAVYDAWRSEWKQGDITVEIKRFRNKRSLEANAYAWVLMDKIAAATRQTPLDIYRETVRNVAGNSDIHTMKAEAAERFIQIWQRNGIGWIAEILSETRTPGYVNIIAFYGSSTYDTEQMSRLIDLLIADCKELGIEHLPPEEIERMVAACR